MEYNNVETFLLNLGIRTYFYSVITPITAETEVQIGQSISTELGWIYGISTQIVGVTPKNKTVALPTAAQAADLYLNLQNAQTWYINDLRFTDMVYYNPTGAVPNNPQRYFPVNIPYTTDLKESIIRNPQGASGFSTMLSFYYIPKATYIDLVAKGIIKDLDKGIV